MKDGTGRIIDYMRISITDRCNLRCRYCMPDGIQCLPRREILTLEEMEMTAVCAARLGIRHIKITGGEPLVRKDCCDLVKRIRQIPGIETVTITTNGILLAENLNRLEEAGIGGINISLDTLDPDRYRELTGGGEISRVLEGLDLAAASHIPVKINAVSLDLGEQNWKDLLELGRERPVDVRFIEMMPIGYGKNFPSLDHRVLLKQMEACYPGMEKDSRRHGFGPAVYYKIPGFKGSVGFISAIHGKFCSSCNRIRLTAQGYLKTCLCYSAGTDLRKILRADIGDPAEKERRLEAAMEEAVRNKPQAHCFERPEEITEEENMIRIGG